jgi:hypothetical protein
MNLHPPFNPFCFVHELLIGKNDGIFNGAYKTEGVYYFSPAVPCTRLKSSFSIFAIVTFTPILSHYY